MSAKRLLYSVLVIASFICRVSHAAVTNSAIASPRNSFLNWREVESEDYLVYMANLTAIGCPTQTIRDIVTADVIGVYADSRKETLKDYYQNFQFWQSDQPQAASRAELETQHTALDADMRRVLHELLGADAPLPDITRQWQSAELEWKLAFLPPDKRAQAKAILTDHEHGDQQAKNLSDGINISVDTNELQRIVDYHEEGRADLRNLLSPDEFEMVEMATSWTGENLRRAMVHFAPTEKEFRAIFAAWRKHDEDLVGVYAARKSDPGNDDVYAQIQTYLTEERYNQYRQTWWR